MSAHLLSINQSKTEFLFIGLPQQLFKFNDPTLSMPSNVTITPANSARNLGVIYDSSLTFSEHISSMSKSCFLSIRDLRRIRNTLDYSTIVYISSRDFVVNIKENISDPLPLYQGVPQQKF